MLEIRKGNAVTHIGFGGKLIDYAMLESLREAVTAASTDDNVRALVLDCESGGGDWMNMGEWPARLAHRRPRGSHGPGPLPEQDAIRALRSFMKPTLALLRGEVLRLALDLACVCDIRLAAASASIGDPRIRQGRAPATGISYLLPKLIGQSQAMRILLLGEPIDATEARRIEKSSVFRTPKLCTALYWSQSQTTPDGNSRDSSTTASLLVLGGDIWICHIFGKSFAW